MLAVSIFISASAKNMKINMVAPSSVRFRSVFIPNMMQPEGFIDPKGASVQGLAIHLWTSTSISELE